MQGSSIGPYRVESELGRGAMGVVWRARAPDGGRVAVKLCLAARGADEARRRRFAREARVLQRLDHAAVVRCLDVGEAEGVPYLVLELVEGGSLAEQLRSGPLPPAQAARITREVARAVAHAHSHGVLHRDLKPENVLLTRTGGVKLGDFGLTRDLAPSEESHGLSQSGLFLGSPGYWAPEQARGQHELAGPRTDVWGLGALLFALLTTRPPVDGESLADAIVAVDRPPPPPSSLRPEVPPELDAVCRRCLAVDPGERYASADEVVTALTRWLEPAAARGGRRAAGLAAGALAAVALVLGALALRRAAPPREPPPDVAPATSAPAPAGPPPATTTAPPSEGARLLEGAREALRRHGDTREAASRARDAAAAGADAYEVELLLAEVAFERMRDAEVARHASRASQLAPRRACPLALRAMVARRDGAKDLAAALALDPRCAMARAAERALAEGPLDVAAGLAAVDACPDEGPLPLRALARRLVQDDPTSPQADEVLMVLTKRHPDDVPVLADRMEFLIGARELITAEAMAERCARLAARSPRLRVQLGALALAGSTAQRAAHFAERALELDPEAPTAYTLRAAARLAVNDRRGALADLAALIRLEPTVGLRVRAEYLAQAGDHDAALADLDRLLELEPDDPGTLGARGTLHGARGEHERARRDLDRAVALWPANPNARLNRAACRSALGDLDGAAADLDFAVERWPHLGRAWLLRAELRLERGAARAALEDAEEARRRFTPTSREAEQATRLIERARLAAEGR